MFEYLLIAGLLVGVVLLFLNRKELLNIILERDSTIDANTRTIVQLQEEVKNILITIQEQEKNTKELTTLLEVEKLKNQEVLSQKKSSETRLGQISEHLIPFLDGCNYNPKDLHFLGQPIDYLSFDFDQGVITFIEVKSGNSKPSKRQKIIKNIIKSGRVYYDEIRVNERGITSKREKDSSDEIM